MADDRAEGLGAGAEVRPDGQGVAGDALLGRDVRWVAEDDPGVDQPEGDPGVRDGEVHQPVGALARRIRADRVDDARHLAVSAQQVAGELALTLREAAQLVVREGRQRRARVARDDPVHRRSKRPERRRQAAGDDDRDPEAQQRGDHERGQQDAEDVAVGIRLARDHEEHAGDRQRCERADEHRGHDADPERDHVVSASSR